MGRLPATVLYGLLGAGLLAKEEKLCRARVPACALGPGYAATASTNSSHAITAGSSPSR